MLGSLSYFGPLRCPNSWVHYTETIRDYEADRTAERRAIDALTLALTAAERAAADEEARRATLATFRAYAAEQRDGLDQKTPLDKRRILLAMRTRCVVASGVGLSRVSVTFDLRGVPNANVAFAAPVDDEELVRPRDDASDVIDLTNTPSAELLLDNDDKQGQDACLSTSTCRCSAIPT